MDDTAKLSLLRAMVGTPDDTNWTDDILTRYLDIAGQKIINRAYPYDEGAVTDVPRKYETLQCEIAAYLLNKRGAEGEISHSENGVSRSYENADVPESMLSSITPHCAVIGG